MDEFIFIRVVFFTFFFVTITLTLVTIELVSRVISKLKSLRRKRREWMTDWRFTVGSPEL